ncbi:uncharacterized protein KNAG_0E03070 [Huiozyma naganishii CBS 8797]|uniref:GST C-terminal domain-containing protein n=1 Tax=Huiozyma naganishii (strain ATCC MYA-139 / BCRC 22969 / CBS 8797 / KCTC 17520 / NBRC 10181 / NCYC 3082 / Yp74L-3) TaxID=1071383 RepID=J7S7Y1_HUIN7|nr:hypothetical protein KNAG_0E03070 [Kazachstania naganishii CBS 8797]CCK70566.1 hypothetical protein KNAG_0E03070 [Kazachstania naganishii CBS 8797]
MSRTVLYTSSKFIRPIVPVCLVNHFKLNVNVVDIFTDKDKFKQEFPWAKLPSLVEYGSGYKLTESIAVSHYLTGLSENKSEIEKLLGASNDFKTQSQILRWESLAVSDFLTQQVNYIGPLVGIRPYETHAVEKARGNLDTLLSLYESRLNDNKYLVRSDGVTMGDLLSAASFYFGFKTLYDAEWRSHHPGITNWYNEVTQTPYLESFFKDKSPVEKAILDRSH